MPDPCQNGQSLTVRSSQSRGSPSAAEVGQSTLARKPKRSSKQVPTVAGFQLADRRCTCCLRPEASCQTSSAIRAIRVSRPSAGSAALSIRSVPVRIKPRQIPKSFQVRRLVRGLVAGPMRAQRRSRVCQAGPLVSASRSRPAASAPVAIDTPPTAYMSTDIATPASDQWRTRIVLPLGRERDFCGGDSGGTACHDRRRPRSSGTPRSLSIKGARSAPRWGWPPIMGGATHRTRWSRTASDRPSPDRRRRGAVTPGRRLPILGPPGHVGIGAQPAPP